MDFLPDGPDLLVQDPDGQFVAVVEIKNLQNFTKETATILRRNLMKYGLLPQTPYFLLMSQDKGFLWKEAWQKGPDTPPDYEFPMGNILHRYLQKTSKERLYNVELKSLASQWLTDLAQGKRRTEEEPERTLAQAGFNETIKEATVI